MFKRFIGNAFFAYYVLSLTCLEMGTANTPTAGLNSLLNMVSSVLTFSTILLKNWWETALKNGP